MRNFSVYAPSKTTKVKDIRGAGQATHDPLQFVATKKGENMAEEAKHILTVTEQQRRQRESVDNLPKSSDEPWALELDTWRKKRKNRMSTERNDEEEMQAGSRILSKTKSAQEDYSNNRINEDYSKFQSPNFRSQTYSNDRTEEKEEDTREEKIEDTLRLDNNNSSYILMKEQSIHTQGASEDIFTITSPHHEEDSGIDNRTSNSHSPSTSLDFSPRSVDQKPNGDKISSSQAALDRINPPPVHTSSSSPSQDRILDQVLIPVNVNRSASSFSTNDKSSSSDEYPPPPIISSNRDKGSFVLEKAAKFENASAVFSSSSNKSSGVQPFRAKSLESPSDNTAHVELTVELNREQKGQVSAVKYPGKKSEQSYSSYSHRDSSHQNHSISTPDISSTQWKTKTTPIYRAVDIPFDESPTSYQPKPRLYDDDNVEGRIIINMGSYPIHRGMGFSVTNSQNGQAPVVDRVVGNSPADKARLKAGDRIVSINGETVIGKYPSTITRMINEAARLGEADIRLEKQNAPSNPIHYKSHANSQFDKNRSIFSDKPIDSYAEFKRKHTRFSRDSPQSIRSNRDYNSLPRSSSTGTSIHEIGRRRDNSASSYRTAPDGINSRSPSYNNSYKSEYGSLSRVSDPDYRVSCLNEKSGPGKLSDFIPEVERTAMLRESTKSRDSFEDPLLIRNYDLPLTKPTTPIATASSFTNFERNEEDEGVTAVLKRSTLPRNSTSRSVHEYSDEDTSNIHVENRNWRDVINEQRQPAPGQIHDKDRIREASASLGHLPAIITKKREENLKKERDVGYRYSQDLDYRSIDRSPKSYEKTQTEKYEKRYSNEEVYSPSTPNYNSFGYGSNHSETMNKQNIYDDIIYNNKEEREHSGDDGVVAVSGKHRCAHCGEELGRGAAMIVESLQLFYHLACFKCYVCKTSLGSGVTGADVRVREGRLHCQSCYSNDKVQLSKV